MPSPTYVATGVITGSVSPTSYDVAWPAGITTSDVAFLEIASRDTTVTLPAGWTLFRDTTVDALSQPMRTCLAWKVYTSGDAAPTIGASNGLAKTAVIHAYRGANTAAAVHVAGTPSNYEGTDLAFMDFVLSNGITTSVADCTIVYWGTRRTTFTSVATMSTHSGITWAERLESGGTNPSMFWGDGALAAAGAVASATLTTAGPNVRPWSAGYFAIAPAGGGATVAEHVSSRRAARRLPALLDL